ncbi:MAG: hypothetical protein VX520_10525 [Planctomycetota bacterium]|nr:hypothetical protein [Planctomycetota bacterium]
MTLDSKPDFPDPGTIGNQSGRSAPCLGQVADTDLAEVRQNGE